MLSIYCHILNTRMVSFSSILNVTRFFYSIHYSLMLGSVMHLVKVGMWHFAYLVCLSSKYLVEYSTYFGRIWIIPGKYLYIFRGYFKSRQPFRIEDMCIRCGMPYGTCKHTHSCTPTTRIFIFDCRITPLSISTSNHFIFIQTSTNMHTHSH